MSISPRARAPGCKNDRGIAESVKAESHMDKPPNERPADCIAGVWRGKAREGNRLEVGT